ncbi:putative quinol monooxygenase [Pelagibius sp. Alg239-R121]|uniref:putative quinol monooxygenase n=1 Tax=Pelagibius sp. Alg239-R121 TaxID=2993448 RepID=UPI0024A693E9|nr:putative quinol monooxygenase [Pelagibius sp. Alg239-R121]
MPLIILAQITAASGKEDLVRSELERLVAPTRTEEGCVQYDLHQDNANPAFFVFYEIWENRDLWQAHTNQPHIAAYRAATEGAVADFQLNEMSKIA